MRVGVIFTGNFLSLCIYVSGMENAELIKESVKAKLKQKAKMTLVTLNTPAPKIASEYYSQDEMVKFNKPKKKV